MPDTLVSSLPPSLLTLHINPVKSGVLISHFTTFQMIKLKIR